MLHNLNFLSSQTVIKKTIQKPDKPFCIVNAIHFKYYLLVKCCYKQSEIVSVYRKQMTF